MSIFNKQIRSKALYPMTIFIFFGLTIGIFRPTRTRIVSSGPRKLATTPGWLFGILNCRLLIPR